MKVDFHRPSFYLGGRTANLGVEFVDLLRVGGVFGRLIAFGLVGEDPRQSG